MSPTIVLKGGQPILTVGAAGGPTIITQTLLAITNILDLGQSPRDSLSSPRFHHQWRPESLKIESKIGVDVLSQLEKLGHQLDKTASMGATQCVSFDLEARRFTPVHDPRVPGGAQGL